MKNKIRSEKGVTLLVLIITIIVLTLLSAVTLSISLGEDGIFERTTKIQFLEEISKIQSELTETELVARSNGQENDKILTILKEDLEEWKDENPEYEDLIFSLELNDEEDTYVLTYKSGGSNRQEQWLYDVNFPGGVNHSNK